MHSINLNRTIFIFLHSIFELAALYSKLEMCKVIKLKVWKTEDGTEEEIERPETEALGKRKWQIHKRAGE